MLNHDLEWNNSCMQTLLRFNAYS